MKYRCRFALAAGCLLFTQYAVAESSSNSKAIASQLFDEASKLLAAGKVSEACAKFAQSNQQDPQLGTLLNLSACYAREGKTASAWVSFKDAADLAAQRRDSREAMARQQVRELEPKVSKLVVTVVSPPPGFELKEDGDVISPSIWGVAVATDPGPHAITATAPGYRPFRLDVLVPPNGQTAHADVPQLLADEPVAVAPAPPPPVTVAPAPPAPPADAPPAASVSHASTQRILGWTATGVGVIGLGVGLIFELKRSSKLNSRNDVCASGKGCTASDQSQIDSLTSDARSAGTIGAIGLISGGVLAAGGIALVLTAHDTKNQVGSLKLTPLIGPGFRGLSLMTNVW